MTTTDLSNSMRISPYLRDEMSVECFSDSCLLRSDVPRKGKDSDYSFHPEFSVKGSRDRELGLF